MNLEALKVAMAWLAIGQQVIAQGAAAWESVKAALAAHGIEADTAILDGVIADAQRRADLARSEAGFQPKTGAELGVPAGSTGE